MARAKPRPPLEVSVRRLIRLSIGLYVIVVLVAGGLVYVGFKAYGFSHDSQRSLCVLRTDLEARVKSSEDFLAKHPHGAFGIPARTIQDGIANQQRTIRALKGLDC
jgi:hypothetical protein